MGLGVGWYCKNDEGENLERERGMGWEGGAHSRNEESKSHQVPIINN